jgi:hypothetical protein
VLYVSGGVRSKYRQLSYSGDDLDISSGIIFKLAVPLKPPFSLQLTIPASTSYPSALIAAHGSGAELTVTIVMSRKPVASGIIDRRC